MFSPFGGSREIAIIYSSCFLINWEHITFSESVARTTNFQSGLSLDVGQILAEASELAPAPDSEGPADTQEPTLINGAHLFKIYPFDEIAKSNSSQNQTGCRFGKTMGFASTARILARSVFAVKLFTTGP